MIGYLTFWEMFIIILIDKNDDINFYDIHSIEKYREDFKFYSNHNYYKQVIDLNLSQFLNDKLSKNDYNFYSRKIIRLDNKIKNSFTKIRIYHKLLLYRKNLKIIFDNFDLEGLNLYINLLINDIIK